MKPPLFRKAIDPFLYLFWASQISIMSACPPLHGVTIQNGMNAERSPALWIKTLLRVAVRAPRAVCRHLRDIKEDRVVLPRVSVGVTTRCTLNCDKCVAHIPDVQTHADVPADEMIRDLQALFACADCIYDLNLSGGETFLHPDLADILRFCAASGKADKIDVSTNGTVMPGAKALAALRETKATVRISDYGPALQPDVEKLKELLKENGITYIHVAGNYWYDTGEFAQPQAGSAKRRFLVCAQRVGFPFFNGKLNVCSYALALEEGGTDVPGLEDGFIDLRRTDPAAFREQWRQLRKRRVISACAYCAGCSYKSPRVPVAIQRARRTSEGGQLHV
ncbi:MAG: hypothetical protein LBC79_02475 [Deltaproteobacteria bacterium]|jgi:hypothetical protein|nr:hypothetical protein [Deltaproteobacteria bacterium]